MRYKIGALPSLGMLLLATTASAADVFSITANVCETDVASCDDPTSNSAAGTAADYQIVYGTDNAEELFSTLDTANLQRLVAQQSNDEFNGNEEIFARIDFRGLPLSLTFPTVNGAALELDIPGVTPENQPLRFNGATREESIDLLVDYLKTNEDGIASRLNQQLVRSSPNDPIAGNPGSLQSRGAAADFNQSFTQRVSQVWGCSTSASATQMLMLAKAGFGCGLDVADANFRLPAIDVAQLGGPASDAANIGLYDDYFSSIDRQRGENKLNIGVDYALISATPGGGTELETSVLTLPLSYTFVFNGDPRKKFVVRLPFSLSKTEDATAYQIGLSLAYSHPISDVWSISPGLGYSAVGSEDLATAAALTSFSLSSSYTLDFGAWALNIGNTIGQYSTGKIKIGDYESDPDISNTIFTNGLLLSGPSSLLANDLVVEYFITDTRYSGDALFTDNSQEVGINFGKLNTSNEVVTSYLKASISYAIASGDNSNEADVLRLSLQFKF